MYVNTRICEEKLVVGIEKKFPKYLLNEKILKLKFWAFTCLNDIASVCNNGILYRRDGCTCLILRILKTKNTNENYTLQTYSYSLAVLLDSVPV